MTTVAYFIQRHIKCISHLPSRAAHVLIDTSETAVWTLPKHMTKLNNQVNKSLLSFNDFIGEVRKNIDHVVWNVEANFTDKHAGLQDTLVAS